VDRDELCGVRHDPLLLEIDEGKVVAARERAGDALGLRDALVAQRICE
jgi:hypothetical protein